MTQKELISNNDVENNNNKPETRGRKKKPFLPIAIENKNINIPNMEAIKEAISKVNNNSEYFNSKDDNMSDNFFRAVIMELLSDKNISLKTEYLSVNENFAGAKLEFLSKYANMPELSVFLKTLETKRVSLNRKSRIELIKAFDKRDEEVDAQNRIRDFKTMLGM
jgi:hypothetical protein